MSKMGKDGMSTKIKISTISDIIILLYFCTILGDALNLTLLNLITFSALIFYFLSGARNIRATVKSSYFLWLAIFVLYVWVGFIWAISESAVFNMSKTLIKMLIMMFFIYAHTNSFEKLCFRIKQFLFANIFMMIKVLLSFFSGKSRLDAFPSGVGLYFNSVAQILAFSIILTFWLILRQRATQYSKGTIGYCIYIIAAYSMIVWSGSRKSILMPIVGLLIIIVFGEFGIKKQVRYFIMAVLLGLAAGYVVLSNDLLSARFIDLFNTMFKGAATDVSEVERKYYRETAAMLFMNNPIIGLGADGFMSYLSKIGYSHVAYCHNNWLEVLSAYGTIGGILYYWYYIYAIIKLRRNRLNFYRMGVVLCSIVTVLFAFEYGIVTYYFPMYHVLFCFIAVFIKCSKTFQVKDQYNEE